MRKVTRNTKGFALVELLIILVVLVAVGGVGAFAYHQSHKTKKAPTSSTTSKTQKQTNKNTMSAADQAKSSAMATWSTFTDANIGLTFRYPSDWGQAAVAPHNATPTDPSGKFYVIAFSNSASITVNPTASLTESSTTFDSLKADNAQYPSSRHVFVSESTVIGDIVPSIGNQDVEVYAARTLKLPKVDASGISLFDSRPFAGSCTQSSYASCYTTDELNDYQWMLESAAAL